MSYFDCDLGNRYYPFGIPGKSLFKKTFSDCHSNDSKPDSSIPSVPIVSLPMYMSREKENEYENESGSKSRFSRNYFKS